MTRLCAAVGLAAFALVHQAASVARAETSNEPSLNVVRLVGAESCEDGSALARAVSTRLGHRAFASPESASGAVEVVLSHEGSTFRAEVRSYDASGALSGVRTVRPDAHTCAALTDAVAIVLSVMVDPAAALGPAPAVAPEPEKIPEAAPKAAAPVSVAPAPKAPVSRLVAAFARGLVGVLPGPALALGAAYEQSLAFGGLRIDASASLVHEQRRSVRSEGFRMALASAGAMYCPLYFTRSIVRFSACLGAEGGVWYLSTFGVLSGTHKTAPFLAGSGRAGLSVALGDHAALQLGIAADALVLRPEYTFAVADGSRETAYRAPALTALGDVGLAARF